MHKITFLKNSSLYSNCKIVQVLGFLLAIGFVLCKNLTGLIDTVGWSSGFIHPLHGADHLLAMLAVGIWAAQMRGSAIWLLPLTFVGVMSLGGLAGATGVLLPGAEAVVLLSCLVFVGLITRKIRFSSQTNVLIVAFFAFFHGYAHGQEISTSASLISYTLGFMVATLLLHGAGILVVRLCVLIVGFFISQLSFAQTAADHTPAHQSIATTTSVDLNIFHFAKVADSRHIESGGVQSVLTSAKAETYYSLGIPSPEVLQTQPSHKWSASLCHQPGRHFLTSGVGLASPPHAVIDHARSRHCTAILIVAQDVSESRRKCEKSARLVIPAYHLATSFLSNGVGLTSPPLAVADNFSLSFKFYLDALGNSAATSNDYQHGIHAMSVFASPFRPFSSLACLPNIFNADRHRAIPLLQPLQIYTDTAPNKAHLYALLRIKDRPPRPYPNTHATQYTYNNNTKDNNGRQPNPYTA